MIALLIIDMQVGLFGKETPRHDAEGVVGRINALARVVRQAGGIVILIQHDGPPGDPLERGTDGWGILASLERQNGDMVVHKRACDAFYETDLSDILHKHDARQLIVTGCATDFCVDTTVRAAASRDYEIVVVEDGHTTADRPHLDAVSVVRHHNWVWQNLLHPRRQIKVLPAASIIGQVASKLREVESSRPTTP
ncbi:MAG: cysteine hydrolase [Betaproteobacteria bacterium]|nr:cysteine hydrolase [Betaproteobacteria bacterium]